MLPYSIVQIAAKVKTTDSLLLRVDVGDVLTSHSIPCVALCHRKLSGKMLLCK